MPITEEKKQVKEEYLVRVQLTVTASSPEEAEQLVDDVLNEADDIDEFEYLAD